MPVVPLPKALAVSDHVSDHVDTLRDDLARLDRRIEDHYWATIDKRVVDIQAWREHRRSLQRRRHELHRALEEAIAREEAEADLGGDAA
jgi:ubiquinone biosynthesis protein UbiJ